MQGRLHLLGLVCVALEALGAPDIRRPRHCRYLRLGLRSEKQGGNGQDPERAHERPAQRAPTRHSVTLRSRTHVRFHSIALRNVENPI